MSKKILGISVFILIVFSNTVFANKTSITINAPESAEKGTEITIQINISHEGNNFIHHTNWVSVTANDEEIARWEFSMFDTPESENFSKELKYTITAPTKITAQGNCNIHGSDGAVTVKINTK